jgi:hypothetical protein
MQDDDGMIDDFKYTCCEQTIIIDNDPDPSSRPFYLSDTPDSQFDHSKVGRVANGRYLVAEGYAGYEDDPELGIFVYEIVQLNDREYILKYWNGKTATMKAFDVHTMQYILNNTPTERIPFGWKIGAPDGYSFLINNRNIPNRAYTNVQLTQFTDNTSIGGGRFLRKMTLSNGNHVVVVSFGSTDLNRTDVLCLVNSSGTILSTVEGLVIVDGIKVKEYTLMGETVRVSQVVPRAGSPSIGFGNFSFLGNVVHTDHNVVNGRFVEGTKMTTSEKTFTKARMSDPSLNVSQY